MIQKREGFLKNWPPKNEVLHQNLKENNKKSKDMSQKVINVNENASWYNHKASVKNSES